MPTEETMSTNVHARDVAAAFRARLPGLTEVKLHKLLYYAQAHHLATFGEPIFVESLSAWDMGPVVGSLWYAEKNGEDAPVRPLGSGELNTVGYVISRYGGLSGRDLAVLSHNEEPWLDADKRRQAAGEQSAKIDADVMRAYFAEEFESEPFSSAQYRELVGGAQARAQEPRQKDDLDQIRRRIAEWRASA